MTSSPNYSQTPPKGAPQGSNLVGRIAGGAGSGVGEAATQRLLRICQETSWGRRGAHSPGYELELVSSIELRFRGGGDVRYRLLHAGDPADPGTEFGVDAAQTGLTISVVVVAMAAGAWIWGPLSDRIGRKRCLVLSSGLVVAPTVALGPRPSFAVLLGCRLLQGLCMPWPSGSRPKLRAGGLRGLAGGQSYGLLSVLPGRRGGLIGRVGVAWQARWWDGASPSPLSPYCPV